MAGSAGLGHGGAAVATQSTGAPATGNQSGQLKPNAVGLVGVIFMVVAFSAPITAMTGNVPAAVGFGNGIGAPAGFIVACIILAIFSVAFVAMAKHITAAGAFYTFTARGLGRPVGLGTGWVSMVAYISIEAAVIALFGVFFNGTVLATFGLDISWIIWAVLGVILIGILSYRDISLAAKVLGVVLVVELALLSIMAFGVLFAGGGPDGLMFESINPLNAFQTLGLPEGAGVAGLGLLFAFWSWVGFEATAIFGEESKDPKKVVPRATMIAVIGIGVFYTFISWMAVAGNGAEQAVAISTSATPLDLLFVPMETYVGHWGVVGMEWFVLGGSFACALAIHNSATRYLFAFGRDGLLPRALGRSHPKYMSPYIASTFQTVLTLAILLFTYFAAIDPYLGTYLLLAILATVMLLFAQTLTCLACIWYFHVRKQHPETANFLRTILAPLIGGAGMVYVLYLLVGNLAAVTGQGDNLFVQLIPWITLAVFVIPVIVALIWRKTKPDTYNRIGSTIFTDAGLTTDIS